MNHKILATALIAGFLCCTAASADPVPSPAAPKRTPEPTKEQLEKYRAMSDSELRNALNEMSHKAIEAGRGVRDQEKELVFEMKNGDYHNEEIDAARAKVDALRRDLAAAEQALQAAILALPEMQDRAKKISKAQEDATVFQQERAAIRQAMAERRPNKGPRPGAVLPPEASVAPTPVPASEPKAE